MAAPRIKTYDETQVGTPSAQVSGAQGRGYDPFEIDVAGMGRAFEGILQEKEKAELDNARADLVAQEPEAQLAFTNELARLQREWVPGQKPLAEQMSTFVASYTDELEKSITNPKAKQLARERGSELRLRYSLAAAQHENVRQLDHRISGYKDTYRKVANLSATDPKQLGVQLATLNAAVMADSQIPEADKATFVREHANAAALEVAKTQAELSPEQALAYVNSRLGVSEPTLTVKSGGSVLEEIIKRESGGRQYDASGKTLRGAAIKTRDGQTIYAYGKYQLLESTAQATAKELGVPWNRELFFRDKTGDPIRDAETAQYHDLLGTAYVETQKTLFGGDPVLIAAAHNMGPAATKGWAAGRPYQTQSGKWWYPKGPKDLNAMPEETRKYVEGLGKVETKPVATDGEEALAYRLLDNSQLLAVRSAAQARLAEIARAKDAQLELDKELFKQRVTDLEVAAKNGDPVEIPSDGELVTFLGPAKAALTKQKLLDYRQMAGGLKQLPGLSNAELRQVASMPDPEGPEDRENRQFVRDTLVKQAQAQLTARQADPGKAALEASPAVKDTYTAWQQAAADFYGTPDAARTPEQFAAVNAAQARYVQTSFALQRTWGIAEPKLPADVVSDLAAGFRSQLRTDPRGATARFAALPKQLGSFDALQQVAAKAGDLGWFAMEQVPPNVMVKLQQAMALKPEGLNKQLPEGVKPADVSRAVANAFAPLTATLQQASPDGAGDSLAANRYLNAGVALATQSIVTGQASDPSEAAQQAYAELYGDREAVIDGVRIPRELGPEQVAQGLRRRLEGLDHTTLFAHTPSPGLTLEETQFRIARAVRRQGRWVTNETGTGAYLMRAGVPVRDTSGKPISVSFTEAAQTPATRTSEVLRGVLDRRGK